jgi:REP element-mobilizing transposase RayT
VQNRECIFGEIVGVQNFEPQQIRLNEIGEIAQNCWLEIPQHYPDTGLHNFVVMPNHIHGIIEITANVGVYDVGVQNFEPLRHQRNEFQHIIPRCRRLHPH